MNGIHEVAGSIPACRPGGCSSVVEREPKSLIDFVTSNLIGIDIMGMQICYVILCRSNQTGEILVAEVHMAKSRAEARTIELSKLFHDSNTFEMQSSILETPDVCE